MTLLSGKTEVDLVKYDYIIPVIIGNNYRHDFTSRLAVVYVPSGQIAKAVAPLLLPDYYLRVSTVFAISTRLQSFIFERIMYDQHVTCIIIIACLCPISTFSLGLVPKDIITRISEVQLHYMHYVFSSSGSGLILHS